MPEKKEFSRLPVNVIPSVYDLKLQPNLTTFTFEGEESISVQVKEETKTVTLNSADIKIHKVKYVSEGQEFIEGVEISYCTENEEVVFTFPEPLKVGDGKLVVVFSGELNDQMKGFYRSKYTGSDGSERYCAVTQFESTDARRAFPCWDEPAAKAAFDVSLVVPTDRVALSNMPIVSDTPHEKDANLHTVKYERTPIMSTYLLAFVVGEYDYIEEKDSDGVLVRVYTPIGKKEQGQFALDVAVKTLPFYKDYFGIAYPLPKMDLIAIADFAAGAMENWGLVTYRETALLVDPQNSSAASKQRVAIVVGHEIAHQWFGNLVTMEWWTHLWLNEGFASWIEYLCVDYCFPKWDIWTQFVASDYTRALELDALRSSHPIEVPVGHPSEVDEIFDEISYNKGACIIRMLNDFIGDEAFRAGLNKYLTKHAYSNTQTEDLWQELEEASNKPVQSIMSTWTKQMGYPVITASEVKEGNKRIVKLRQDRFCADGKKDGDDSLWMVPLTFSSESSPNKAIHKYVLEEREATITLENVPENDWIKLNVGVVGFYRTRYSSEWLESLENAITAGSLPPRDRLGLQNDLFALARAGIASTVDALKAASAFKAESNFTVWQDMLGNLGALNILLQYTDYHNLYQKFVLKLVKDAASKLGWDVKSDESHLDAMLRGMLLATMGKNGCQESCDEARKRFAKHESKECILPPDLRGAVYGMVLRSGDAADFDRMIALHESADLQEEKVRILRSLGSVQSPELIQRVLKFALSEHVRSQDTVFVISGACGSVAGRQASWEFTQSEWEVLNKRYGGGGFLLVRLIKIVTENFASEAKAEDVKSFFEKNPCPSAERSIRQSLENITLNVEQLRRDEAAIKDYLNSSCS